MSGRVHILLFIEIFYLTVWPSLIASNPGRSEYFQKGLLYQKGPTHCIKGQDETDGLRTTILGEGQLSLKAWVDRASLILKSHPSKKRSLYPEPTVLGYCHLPWQVKFRKEWGQFCIHCASLSNILAKPISQETKRQVIRLTFDSQTRGSGVWSLEIDLKMATSWMTIWWKRTLLASIKEESHRECWHSYSSN